MLLGPTARCLLFVAALTGPAGAATACLPPLPGEVEPSLEDRLRSVARDSSDIAYGEIVRGSYRRGARFRVIHVYRGSLRPGSTIDAEVGWGFGAPPCAGMMVPPPVLRGRRGVIFFSGGPPTMNFIGETEVAMMFRLGLLEPGPHDR